MYTPKYKMYIRGQDHITNDKFENKTYDKERGVPSGYRFSAEQGILVFGREGMRLMDIAINEYGSYVCCHQHDIYQTHLNTLLKNSNLTYEELDNAFHFASDLRNADKSHSIWDWVKVCNFFGIDIISFGIGQSMLKTGPYVTTLNPF